MPKLDTSDTSLSYVTYVLKNYLLSKYILLNLVGKDINSCWSVTREVNIRYFPFCSLLFASCFESKGEIILIYTSHFHGNCLPDYLGNISIC